MNVCITTSYNIINDWIVSDFTYQELVTLKLKVVKAGVHLDMRLPWFDGQFQIPTFQNYLDLIHGLSFRLNKKIGILPELKHAQYHNQLFEKEYFMENVFMNQLEENGYPKRGTNPSKGTLIIQNFEKDSARYIRGQSDYKIMQLIFGNVETLTPKGLDEIREYANAVGIHKEFYTLGAMNVIEYGLSEPDLVYDEERIKSLGGFINPELLPNALKSRKLEQYVYTFYSSYEPAQSVNEYFLKSSDA